MNRFNPKIPAFTLTEILVVLALSTIVIGLAFSVLNLFSKNLMLIQNNYHQSGNRQLVEQQLWVDFHSFTELNYDRFSRTLKLKTPLDSITYTFEETYLLREKDTLFQGTVHTQFFNEGTQQAAGLIDAVKLLLSIEQDTAQIFVYRLNDAKTNMSYGN